MRDLCRFIPLEYDENFPATRDRRRGHKDFALNEHGENSNDLKRSKEKIQINVQILEDARDVTDGRHGCQLFR